MTLGSQPWNGVGLGVIFEGAVQPHSEPDRKGGSSTARPTLRFATKDEKGM